MGNELTREQQLALQIADYFNIDVPDIISEYVTDSLTVQRMIYALVTVRNTDRLKKLYSDNPEPDAFYEAVQNYNTDTYMDNDKLAAQIKEANDLAVKVTQANIEIRDLFQNQVKAAYDKEKETQKKLMEQYQLTLDEKERAYKLMMTQRDEARTKIKMLEAQISDMEDKLNIGSANLDQDSSRKTINTGFFSKLFSKKKDENAAYVYDSFVKEIASDKRYSAEQKDFLMRCMEDGFVYEEIRRIARPELDVAMMERLANYYKKKVK
ncbi:MAG: hypothetical protein ACLUF4_04040 [Lachnospira eligens]|jgi:hypothetical protein